MKKDSTPKACKLTFNEFIRLNGQLEALQVSLDHVKDMDIDKQAHMRSNYILGVMHPYTCVNFRYFLDGVASVNYDIYLPCYLCISALSSQLDMCAL